MEMFCYQCEQAANGSGCTVGGVCGKKPEVAALQDLIVYQLKGISWCAHEARKLGKSDATIDRFAVEALFTTVTNVNFDPERLEVVIRQGDAVLAKAHDLYAAAAKAKFVHPDERTLPDSAKFKPAETTDELVEQGREVSIPSQQRGVDIDSLEQLLVYGLKGMAAYANHALLLDQSDDAVFAFIHEALAYLNGRELDAAKLVDLCMRCGTVNIRTMELLDAGNTGRFGHPEPTPVSTGRKKGPAIVVSGHDLLDLELLLKQTEGSGVNIYTHGEMLPAHGYPGLKKYRHLAGHFGTAWQNQQKEFEGQPCCFLFTTNCIQKPRPGYIDRVFTTGLVAWPGVAHVNNRDFSAVINKAKSLGGFEERSGGTLLTGFGRNAVLGVADKVIAAVKSGAIRRFFLVGGCDGTKPGRNYYTEFAEKAPKDTVILTLACGKFRFNHLDLGDIGGIPRLLDVGQCNDAYSALKIAQALAGAFNCGINDLPLSLVLSWYEQKAVVILLSLLSLGIKNIRLGPTLPAFITPNNLKFLVDTFAIKPITSAERDLAEILA
jgi:hydroxylamine reductase